MEQQPFSREDGIEHVVKLYSNMVYRLAFAQVRNRNDADDIFQEVFLRYIKKAPQFESEEHRKAWLLRVTINCSKKFWASPWLKTTVPLEEVAIFELEEDIDIHDKLQQLPMKCRTVIHLFYYEDFSIEQISKALNRKPSTVRAQLTRARYQLKEILKEDCHDSRKHSRNSDHHAGSYGRSYRPTYRSYPI